MGIMAYVLNDSDPEEVAIARVVEEAIGACLCLWLVEESTLVVEEAMVVHACAYN